MNVYIKLETEFEKPEDYDEEKAEQFDRLNIEYKPEIKYMKGYEYILVEGDSQIKSFFEDEETGNMRAYTVVHDMHVAYDITVPTFLEKMKGHIKVIE